MGFKFTYVNLNLKKEILLVMWLFSETLVLPANLEISGKIKGDARVERKHDHVY